jgi:hypothetical protein
MTKSNFKQSPQTVNFHNRPSAVQECISAIRLSLPNRAERRATKLLALKALPLSG